jgi:hypothetical protein
MTNRKRCLVLTFRSVIHFRAANSRGTKRPRPRAIVPRCHDINVFLLWNLNANRSKVELKGDSDMSTTTRNITETMSIRVKITRAELIPKISQQHSFDLTNS